MEIVWAIIKALIGAFFGLLAGMAFAPLVIAFGWNDPSTAPFWICATLGTLLGGFAPTLRRAFGRGFLLVGVAVFALPVTSFLMAGRAVQDTVVQSGAASGSLEQAGVAVGAGLAGAMITGIGTLFGLVMGSILLITGLVLSLGGRREVIVIERREPGSGRAPAPASKPTRRDPPPLR